MTESIKIEMNPTPEQKQEAKEQYEAWDRRFHQGVEGEEESPEEEDSSNQ